VQSLESRSASVVPRTPRFARSAAVLSRSRRWIVNCAQHGLYRWQTGCNRGECPGGSWQLEQKYCIEAFCYDETCERDDQNNCLRCMNGHYRANQWSCPICSTCQANQYLMGSCSTTSNDNYACFSCQSATVTGRRGDFRPAESLPTQDIGRVSCCDAGLQNL
jgi:hypothetical protein